MTKRAPPAGRKRASKVWLILGTDDHPLEPPYWYREHALGMMREGLTLVEAKLTWTEPPKRRPR